MNWVFARGRTPIFVLIATVTAFFGVHASMLGVDTDNRSLDATAGRAASDHREFVDDFGEDEGVFVSLTFPGRLTFRSLADIDEFVVAAEGISGVRRVFAMTNAPKIVPGRSGAEIVPWFDARAHGADAETSFAKSLAAGPGYLGVLVSYDSTSAGVIVETNAGADVRGRVIDSLRATAGAWASRGIEVRVTGIGAEKHEVARLVQRDQAILVPAAVVVLWVVLFWFGRTVTAATLPVAVTGISLCWTLGLLQLTGFALNPITSLLPPVVMVLSVATSVHLYYGWIEADGEATSGARARSALGRLWKPCALTAATTAFGLLALCTSATPAVRQFGAFASFGVFASFVVGTTVVPLWLSRSAPTVKYSARDGLRAALAWCSRFALSSPRVIAAGASILVVVALYGATLVRSNTDLVGFLSDDSRLRRDTEFVDLAFAGTTNLELVISAEGERPMIRPDDVSRLRALREWLFEQSEFRHVTTVLDVLEPLGRAESPGAGESLPDDPMELAYLFDLFAASADPELFRRFAAPDFARLRVTLRGPTIGSADAAQAVARIEARAREIFPTGYRVVPTGTFYRLSQESDRIVNDQVRSFSLAFILVAAAVGAAFRSWRLLTASLLPNLVPIASALGMMGFSGIDLSTGTAMVACVVIGIAVDDTIHYLARFRLAYDDDARTAIAEANTGAGIAMTVTSVVLVLGFWVGAMGSFKPTVYFSLLSGATMLIALVCDLIVLPACLVLVHAKRDRGSPA